MVNEDSQKDSQTWTLDPAPLERLNELGSEIKVGWPMTKNPHKESCSNGVKARRPQKHMDTDFENFSLTIAKETPRERSPEYGI